MSLRGILATTLLLLLQMPAVQAAPLKMTSPLEFIFGRLPETNTMTFGATRTTPTLSTTHLRLLVWNIHKGEDRLLAQDFAGLSENADIVLFQEAMTDPVITTQISEANHSFTGVATGSRAKPLHEDVLISKVTEPISSTPKSILLSEFKLADREDTLLIANVHGINFVATFEYKVQIRQLIENIREHVGPVIVAGDFNTWNTPRLEYVKTMLAPLGISHIETPETGNFFSLDHIFVRGLSRKAAYNLNHIKTSDHIPLLVDLSFDPPANQLSKVVPSVQH